MEVDCLVMKTPAAKRVAGRICVVILPDQTQIGKWDQPEREDSNHVHCGKVDTFQKNRNNQRSEVYRVCDLKIYVWV